MRYPILILTLALLCGCSSMRNALARLDNTACSVPEGALGMQLDLVRQQMQTGKYHAALAHLDTVDPALPQALLLRARALRAIDAADAAAASYLTLSTTCLGAYGHQGLGTLAADRRDIAAALHHLHEARRLAPTDADIRNDYGFVLLAAGHTDQALREFHTAVELNDGDQLAVRNLVLALFIAQHAEQARQLAERHTLSTAEIEALARRAGKFRPLPDSSTEIQAHEAS
jgi:Flp pilus assembly protein TadD